MYKHAYSSSYSNPQDTYNARYSNIANPSQVARWRQRGFSDAQIRQYTDRQVRQSMGGYSPPSSGSSLPRNPSYPSTSSSSSYSFRSRPTRSMPTSSSVSSFGTYTTPQQRTPTSQSDTYNARYNNIANPSQVSRWKQRGFSDDQIRQYTDRQVRQSMGGYSPYGSGSYSYASTPSRSMPTARTSSTAYNGGGYSNRYNGSTGSTAYNDTYNKRYNNIANPSQVARWKARGFSDAQIKAYTDRQVRQSMSNRGY